MMLIKQMPIGALVMGGEDNSDRVALWNGNITVVASKRSDVEVSEEGDGETLHDFFSRFMAANERFFSIVHSCIIMSDSYYNSGDINLRDSLDERTIVLPSDTLEYESLQGDLEEFIPAVLEESLSTQYAITISLNIKPL